MIKLTTPRLLLREYEETDWRAVHEYASDPEVVRFWFPSTEEMSRQRVQERMAARSAQPRVRYSLAATLNGRVIGGFSLKVPASIQAEGELGFALNREFW